MRNSMLVMQVQDLVLDQLGAARMMERKAMEVVGFTMTIAGRTDAEKMGGDDIPDEGNGIDMRS